LPIGRLRIGGPNAKPLIGKWEWFSITLCTTIATGILFWGIAEPIFHLHEAPKEVRSAPFSMSTMYLHWTLIPYSIYTLAAVVFAIAFYNLKQPFRVSSMLYPLLGKRAYGPIGILVDSLCLFALVAGMAASLGAGILSISGGLEALIGYPQNSMGYALVGSSIALVFIISAVSGLQKGIKTLSSWNIRFFFLFALFILISGPTLKLLDIGGKGIVDFVQHFPIRALGLDKNLPDSWLNSWTVFYWANWLAWTPVTALFLGRLGRGYTVRQFLCFNLLFPSLFGAAWMMIFSGSAIHFDLLAGAPLYAALQTGGPQAVVFELLANLPFLEISSVVFVLIVFVSYVTAADSNTSALTGLSQKGITPESQEAAPALKIIWGIMVALIAWIMISFAGIEGIKMASNLGGFPALIICLFVAAAWIKLLIKSFLHGRI
ncbi:MAG: BCCT family transporter, partial [Luteibaculum sp.]